MKEVKKMTDYDYDLRDIGLWALEETLRPAGSEINMRYVGAEIVSKLYNGELRRAYDEIISEAPMNYELKVKLDNFLTELNF